jgi:hypothetical protein
MSKHLPKTERQTYYLVAGEVISRPADGEVSSAVIMNALVISADGRFSVQQIAKAQQALQFQFYKRMNDPSIQILDVVLVSLMNLGTFTDAEFNATPAGMKMEEIHIEDVLNPSKDS